MVWRKQSSMNQGNGPPETPPGEHGVGEEHFRQYAGVSGGFYMKATNILWDVDCKSDLEFLPTEVQLPEGMTDQDEISDYLSDLTGFCHAGFALDTD